MIIRRTFFSELSVGFILICLHLTALRAFEIELAADKVVSLPGATHESVTLDLTGALPQDLEITSEEAWLSFIPKGEDIEVIVNAGELISGDYTGTISVSDGSETKMVSLQLELLGAELRTVVADIDDPWIYFLTRRFTWESKEVVILGRVSTETWELFDTVMVEGRFDSLVLHGRDKMLWLNGQESAVVKGVDKGSMEETRMVDFSGEDFFGPQGGPIALLPGGEGRLLALSTRVGGLIPLVDTTAGTILDTTLQPGTIGIASPCGGFVKFSSTAYGQETIRTFDLRNDRFEKIDEEYFWGGGVGDGGQVISSEDGTTHIASGTLFGEMLQVERRGASAFDLSWTGRRVLNQAGFLNLETNELVFSIPNGLSFGAISPDQTKVVKVEAFRARRDTPAPPVEITWFDIPDPDSKASVPLSPIEVHRPGDSLELRWTGHPLASEYRVYLSGDRADVENREGASLLGSFACNSTSLPSDLVGGEQYFWRVDRILDGEIDEGEVFEFTEALVGVIPSVVALETIEGTADISFDLTTAGAPGRTWTVSSVSPFLEFESETGSAGEDIKVSVDSSKIPVDDSAPGTEVEAIVMVSFGDEEVEIPVTLRIHQPRPSALLPGSPRDDTLISVNAGSFGHSLSFVVETNLATGVIERALPVGSFGRSLQDFEGNMLYQIGAIEWSYSTQTAVIAYDLGTMTRVSEVTLEYEAIPLGITDGFLFAYLRGEAFGAGPNRDQYVTFDLETGKLLHVLEEGDSLPFYLKALICRYQGEEQMLVYRASDAGQGGTVGRLERVTRDGFVLVHSGTDVPNPRLDYQSTTPLISRDGERIFVGNSMVSRDLTEVVAFTGSPFVAVDATGDRATNVDFFYTDPVEQLRDFAGGSPSEHSVISENNNYLAYYRQFGSEMVIVDLRTAAPFPKPTPTPGTKFIGNPPVFSVGEVEGADSYILTVKREADGVEVERVEGGPELSLSKNLRQGTRYLWRIDAVTESGVVSGEDIPFETGMTPDADYTAFSPYSLVSDGFRLAILQYTVAGITPALADGPGSALLSKTSLHSFEVFDGFNGFPDLNGESELAGRFYFLSDPLGVRVYEQGEDGCYEYQRTVSSRQGHSGRFFGNRMASNQDELFVATSTEVSGPASIEIYETEPELKWVQTLVLPDLIGGDSTNLSFVRMAAGGDVLAVGSGAFRSSGNGTNANLLIYVRDVETGRWSLQQTLNNSPVGVRMGEVTTDGKTIAWSGRFPGSLNIGVRTFARNEDNLWVEGSTLYDPFFSSGFGVSVLVQGNTLVVRSTDRNQNDSEQISIYRRGESGWEVQTKYSPEGYQNQYDMARSLARVGTTLFINSISGVQAFDDLFANEEAPRIRSIDPLQVIQGQRFSKLIELDDSTNVTEVEDGPSWLSLSLVSPGVYQLEGEVPLTGVGERVRLKTTSTIGVSSYQVLGLEVVTLADLPSVELSADRESVFSGDSVMLRTEVDGVGPLGYEWFLNGEKIENENGAELALVNVQESQGGSYSVTVKNAVGEATSDSVELVVIPASTFGGSWTMSRGDARHRNFTAAKLGNFELEKIWSMEGRTVWNAAVLDGKVYAASYSNLDAKVTAFNIEDGAVDWEFEKPNRWFFQAPSVDSEGVYFTGYPLESRGSQAISLNRTNGATRWARNFSGSDGPQGEYFTDPVIGLEKIWIPNSNSGGLLARNLSNGLGVSGEGFRLLGDINTPSLSGRSGYVLANQEIVELNLEGPSIEGRRSLGITENSGWGDQILPVQGGMTFVRRSTEIYAYHLKTKARVWTASLSPEDLQLGLGFIQPLVMNGSRIATVMGNRIRSYSLETGELLPDIFLPGESLTRSLPVILNDVIIATTTAGTHIASLDSGEIITTLPEGGTPIYAEGHLFIFVGQDRSGEPKGLAVYRVDSKDFLELVTEELPDAIEDESYLVELAALSSQPIEEISFELIDAPAWLLLSEDGLLSGTPRHGQGGDFEVRFRVTDGVNDPLEISLPVKVVEVNDAPVIASLDIEMNEDSVGFVGRLEDFVSDEETQLGDLLIQLSMVENQPDLFSASLEGETLMVVPKADLFGSSLLRITVTDLEGLATEADIPVSILPVDDPPRLLGEIPDLETDGLGSDLMLDLLTHFFDPDPEDVLNDSLI